MLSERHIFFSFLRIVSRKKFLRDLGVSLISDNRDNNFVEPWVQGINPAAEGGGAHAARSGDHPSGVQGE